MTSVSAESALVVAGILFVLGLVGVMVRRNILFVLMSLEIMLNAAGLAFVVGGARWMRPDGQVIFIFILAVAAAEISVGLALFLRFFHYFRTLNSDEASALKG
jgi:NADH-quinone oxidoreductase subunit K